MCGYGNVNGKVDVGTDVGGGGGGGGDARYTHRKHIGCRGGWNDGGTEGGSI